MHHAFLWQMRVSFFEGTPQNGWFPFGFAYTLERETDPNGKSWDPHGLPKAVYIHIYIYKHLATG